MSRLRRSVKWGLCRCMFLSHFAACRGALHGDRGCHLSGPIPAGNYCAPAGGTHHPGLSSVRFFGQPRRSCRRNISPRPQLSPFFLQSPFSLHLSGGVGRALFDCQCWIRGIERGWQRAGGTCFGFVALLKWPLWCARSKGTSPPAAAFSHCNLRLMKYQGPSLRAAAPLLQAKHVPPTSAHTVLFPPSRVPCLSHRLDGLRARLQNVTEGGGISV